MKRPTRLSRTDRRLIGDLFGLGLLAGFLLALVAGLAWAMTTPPIL